jgi:hypothetical protein
MVSHIERSQALAQRVERDVTDEGRRDSYDEIVERHDISYGHQDRLVAEVVAEIILTHQQVRIKQKYYEAHFHKRAAKDSRSIQGPDHRVLALGLLLASTLTAESRRRTG